LVHDNSAGTIARELWWTSQFYSVDIIPPWFSMLIYHLGDIEPSGSTTVLVQISGPQSAMYEDDSPLVFDAM
jgi:hypothetical protein